MSIAVLVTTHDASSFVRESLESISRQERTPDEVIVIDDKSTDGTLDIVQTWAKSQPFAVQILENQLSHEGYPTPGPAGSRTTGLRRTNADLIAVLDHDDLMLPMHLRLTEQAMLRYPDMELCFGDATEFDGDGSHQNFFSGKNIEGVAYQVAEDGLRILTEPMLKSLLHGSYVPTAANMWRRKTGLAIGGFDRRAGGSDDLRFFSTLSRMGKVGYFPFPIALKRVHLDNMSHPKNAIRICWDHVLTLLLMEDEAQKLHLTARELTEIESQIEELTREIAYHSSRKGIGTYWNFSKRLGHTPRPRDVARALFWSGRNVLDHTPPSPAARVG